ncbi:MAG: AraC family transcriptional regulator [Planctomycetes bacterium]|nr:AraC family transcriptional regulator [Planctomycetota bacterium]
MAEPARLPDSCWGGAPRAREPGVRWVARYRGPRRCPHPDTHPCIELTVVLHGSMALETGTRHRLDAGTAVLIPAGLPHREIAADAPDTLWVGLDGIWPAVPALLTAAGGRITALAEELWLAAAARSPGCGAVVDGLVRALTGEVLRQAQAPGDDLVDLAVARLGAQHEQDLSIAALAAELGLSVGWLHRAFRRRTGTTPRAFRERVRLERARDLLGAGGLPVAKVARLVGYNDPLYFSRAYHRHFGHPPSGEGHGNQSRKPDPGP